MTIARPAHSARYSGQCRRTRPIALIVTLEPAVGAVTRLGEKAGADELVEHVPAERGFEVPQPHGLHERQRQPGISRYSPWIIRAVCASISSLGRRSLRVPSWSSSPVVAIGIPPQMTMHAARVVFVLRP